MRRRIAGVAAAVVLAATASHAGDKPRARLLGVPFDGTPGALDAITDVAGVEVGYTTLVSGEGPLHVGVGHRLRLCGGSIGEGTTDGRGAQHHAEQVAPIVSPPRACVKHLDHLIAFSHRRFSFL